MGMSADATWTHDPQLAAHVGGTADFDRSSKIQLQISTVFVGADWGGGITLLGKHESQNPIWIGYSIFRI